MALKLYRPRTEWNPWGRKALQKGLDMTISDILMPRMNVFRLTLKSNERLNKIPFVFCTAVYSDPKDEEFPLILGAERLIVKPTEPNLFIQILTEIIRDDELGIFEAPKAPIEEEAVYLKE